MLASATVGVGTNPYGISYASGSIWVANTGSDSVTRINPTTNSVIASIPVAAAPQLMTSAAGYVWVASQSGTLSKIDPANSTVVASIPVGVGAFDVVYDGS